MCDLVNYKMTKREFAVYKKEVLRLLDVAGMSDWDCRVEFADPELEGAFAAVSYDCPSKQAIFYLTPEGLMPKFGHGKDIKETALHEVLHLILADHAWLIDVSEGVDNPITEGAEHAVLHRLIKLIKEA